MIRYLTAGESHGAYLVGIVDGMPAGLPLDEADINEHLARRWLGYGRGGRAKIEQDRIKILSGVRFGKTIGSPIALQLENASHKKDKSGWPEVMSIDGDGRDVPRVTLPRPGHADLAGIQKYGLNDIRPVIERASARETAMRAACCSVGRIMLREIGIEVGSHVIQLGRVESAKWEHGVELALSGGARNLYSQADSSEVRMLSSKSTQKAIKEIQTAKSEGDTLGGRYEVVVIGVPAGLGSYTQWDQRLDGRLAQAILSIQGQKAVEIGDGFEASSSRGSHFHDPIEFEDGRYVRTTNHAGGIEGGISTGMPIVVRGVMKPIPTLIKPLMTIDIDTKELQETRYERSDVTSVPAASVVAESTVAWAIAETLLDRYGGDVFDDIKDRVRKDR